MYILTRTDNAVTYKTIQIANCIYMFYLIHLSKYYWIFVFTCLECESWIILARTQSCYALIKGKQLRFLKELSCIYFNSKMAELMPNKMCTLVKSFLCNSGLLRLTRLHLIIYLKHSFTLHLILTLKHFQWVVSVSNQVCRV